MSLQTVRKLSKNLELSRNCNPYQIQRSGGGYHLRHAAVTICEHTDGSIEVLHGIESLNYKVQVHFTKQPQTVDTKGINPLMDKMVLLVAEQEAKSVLSTAPAQLSF